MPDENFTFKLLKSLEESQNIALEIDHKAGNLTGKPEKKREKLELDNYIE